MAQHVTASGDLLLTGALTMRTAESICAQLRAAITGHDSVSIDCQELTEVDVTFIQLLVAAGTSARLSDKPVALATRPDGVLLDALTRAGFRVISQDQSATDHAFWFEEATA